MKTQNRRLILIILITGLLLSACNLSLNQDPAAQQSQLATMSAGTVAAQLTQIAVATAFAQLTPQASIEPSQQLTLAPTATVTLLPTSTSTLAPTATFTNTPIPATATATPVPCYLASFVSDVTIADGSSFMAGEIFVKTWRIKNAGSCTWSTNYKIYFLSGNAMSAPASVNFPKTVKPGETVDLSVTMVAPGNTGDYSGNWMLSAQDGTVFGVNLGSNVPLTVKIKVASVPKLNDANAIYDFIKNHCAAQWRTNAGFITCPTASFDYKNGTISRSYAPIIENGLADDEGALITIPAIGGDGFIQGQFPKMVIHSGDHFKATLLCTYQKPKCSVTFELLYMEYGINTVTSLGTWNKIYDNSFLPVDVDLSALDGKDVIFFLKVHSQGDSTDDFAQWMAARVTHP
jgi:hypothetical protein